MHTKVLRVDKAHTHHRQCLCFKMFENASALQHFFLESILVWHFRAPKIECFWNLAGSILIWTHFSVDNQKWRLLETIMETSTLALLIGSYQLPCIFHWFITLLSCKRIGWGDKAVRIVYSVYSRIRHWEYYTCLKRSETQQQHKVHKVWKSHCWTAYTSIAIAIGEFRK